MINVFNQMIPQYTFFKLIMTIKNNWNKSFKISQSLRVNLHAPINQTALPPFSYLYKL